MDIPPTRLNPLCSQNLNNGLITEKKLRKLKQSNFTPNNPSLIDNSSEIKHRNFQIHISLPLKIPVMDAQQKLKNENHYEPSDDEDELHSKNNTKKNNINDYDNDHLSMNNNQQNNSNNEKQQKKPKQEKTVSKVIFIIQVQEETSGCHSVISKVIKQANKFLKKAQFPYRLKDVPIYYKLNVCKKSGRVKKLLPPISFKDSVWGFEQLALTLHYDSFLPALVQKMSTISNGSQDQFQSFMTSDTATNSQNQGNKDRDTNNISNFSQILNQKTEIQQQQNDEIKQKMYEKHYSQNIIPSPSENKKPKKGFSKYNFTSILKENSQEYNINEESINLRKTRECANQIFQKNNNNNNQQQINHNIQDSMHKITFISSQQELNNQNSQLQQQQDMNKKEIDPHRIFEENMQKKNKLNFFNFLCCNSGSNLNDE